MTNLAYALARAELIRVLTAYTGITTAAGLANGTTLIDANLIGKDSQKIVEKTILIMSGDAEWEDKGASAFDTATGKITLQGTGFSAQIVAGTIFRILNISSIEIDVANMDTKIGTNADAAGTTTLFAWLAKLFASGVRSILGNYGVVTTYTDTTHFKASGLTGFGNDYFKNFRVYVVRDAGGAGAAPQGEMQPISDYVSSDGTFTHTAFTAPLAVDDEVIILHPRLAEIASILADTGELQTDWADGGRLDLLIDAILADTGELQTDWADGGRLDLLIDAILVDTGTTIPGTITTMQGNVTDILADTGELQTDWADGGRLDLLIDAILADTGELQTDWADGGRLDLLIDAILLDTGTTIPGTITTMQGNVTDILADTGELQTDWADGGRLDLLIDAILADTGELQTDWANGGRLDLLIDAILLDTGTTIPGTITTMQGNVTDILADTGELQTDWADGGRLDLLIDAILADTGELQTDWADGGRLDLLIDAILLDTGTTIPGTITTMQGNVTDILADTGELQTDWADGGRLDLLIDAILADTGELQTDWADGGRLDLLIDAILLDTGTTIPGTITTLQAAVDELPKWGTPTTGTHTTASENKEQIVEIALTDPYRLWMYIDLRAMQAGDTFQFTVEVKIDGTNYCIKDQQTLTDGQTIDVFEINGLYGDTACDIKVSVQRTGGADRAFPYRYNVKKEA